MSCPQQSISIIKFMHDQTLKHYDHHAEAFTAQYRAAEPEALEKVSEMVKGEE